jgi:hypothetical protein
MAIVNYRDFALVFSDLNPHSSLCRNARALRTK